jgi:AbrB family looped-hinge helix DNA binding protein
VRAVPGEHPSEGFAVDEADLLTFRPDQLAQPIAKRRSDSVGEQLVSALIPDARLPVRMVPALPLAQLVRAGRPANLHYAVTTVDVNGRVADRSLLRRLGWLPGHRIVFGVVSGALLVLSGSDGGHAVSRQGRIRLPAALRCSFNVQAGDRLLLNAIPDRGLLVVYTASAVDHMVVAYHRSMQKQVCW